MHFEALFKALAGTLDMCLIKQKGLRMMEQLYKTINLNTNATDLYMNPIMDMNTNLRYLDTNCRCRYKSYMFETKSYIVIGILDLHL